MKKILPLTVLALAAVTAACSSDDDKGTPANPKDAITFAKPFVQNSVKERTANQIDFNSFKVWGFVNKPDSYIFDDNKVTLDNGQWSVDKTEYWYPNMQYYFTGIAPADNNNGSIVFNRLTEEVSGPFNGGGTIEFDNSKANGRVDLVYAWADSVNNSQSDAPVGLIFNHLLSRAMFSFNNLVSESTSLVIYSMELVNSISKASIDMNGNQTWAPAADAQTSFSIGEIGTGTTVENKLAYNEKDNISESIYLIPASESNYQLKFKVDVYNGQTKVATYDHTVNLPKISFEKANSYKFNATFGPHNLNPEGPLSKIEFTVEEVKDWTDQNIDLI